VRAFCGGRSSRGGLARTNIAVCTFEKASSLINRLIDDTLTAAEAATATAAATTAADDGKLHCYNVLYQHCQ
jgi:hypothetical protein